MNMTHIQIIGCWAIGVIISLYASETHERAEQNKDDARD
jgi:hypothetical protein